MQVLDIPRRCPSGYTHIDIPLYHRVHLNLAAGRALHGCLVACENKPHLAELVISPFEFDRWDKIWRVNMTVADRPGVFNEACDVLTRNGAHLLAAESSTTQQQSLYQMELVIDLEDDTRIEWIRLSLLAKFLRDVTFSPDGRPRLRIQKLHGLWHAKRDFEEQRARPKGFSPQRINVKVKWAKKAPHQVLRLVIPKKARDILKNTVRAAVERQHDDGFYLRLSDTKNRFLRVLYFRSDEPVIHARIEYANKPGATTTITDALKESDFNILTAYYAPSGSNGDRSRLELVMRYNRSYCTSTAKRKTALEEALSNSVGAAHLHIAIGYPRNYANSWDRKGVKASLMNPPMTRPAEALQFKNLHENLVTQYMDLKSMIDRGTNNANDVAKWKLARRLLEKYDGMVEPLNTREKVLFVSCHYAVDQLEMIKTKAESRGFVVVSGKDLQGFDNFRLGLLKRIYSSTHFLGVWSREGAQEFAGRCWPSPWLLWEFGVADAFRLTWRLLISSAIEEASWKRIAPERQHEFFTLNFETKVDEVLKGLSESPATRQPIANSLEIERSLGVAV